MGIVRKVYSARSSPTIGALIPVTDAEVEVDGSTSQLCINVIIYYVIHSLQVISLCVVKLLTGGFSLTNSCISVCYILLRLFRLFTVS